MEDRRQEHVEEQDSDPQHATDKAGGTKQLPVELSASHTATHDSDEVNNMIW